MGTQENKKVVKELYAAFGRRDMAAVPAVMAEDVVWHLPGTAPHYSRTYKGPSSIADFFQKLNANPEIEALEPREFVAESDRVLVTGCCRGSSQDYNMLDNRWVMTFSVRHGKVNRFEEYADTQALPAADCVSSRAIAGVPSTRAT